MYSKRPSKQIAIYFNKLCKYHFEDLKEYFTKEGNLFNGPYNMENILFFTLNYFIY